jgi:hypothetical protein
MHGAAVLAVLEFERMPIRMKFRNCTAVYQVDRWPHMQDGLYTRDPAQELFSRIWEGSYPLGGLRS